jgi:hypothetical protein
MRELTLIETGCFAGLLLLCLVLPLMMSFRAPRNAGHRKACLRTIWTGQSLLATTALVALTSAALFPYTTGLGATGYIICIWALHRQLRPDRIKS